MCVGGGGQVKGAKKLTLDKLSTEQGCGMVMKQLEGRQ